MKYILSLLIILTYINFKAQNLVPNFSFEEHSNCPNMEDQVHFSDGWSKYSTNNINTTPDYYNSCSTPSTFGIPQSLGFYQEDNRNCGAYVGLITRSTVNNSREHIGIQLNQPLSIGLKYFISFRTVMAGSSFGGNYYESPSNNIGMRLSTVPYSPSNPAPIDNFSHLRSVAIISDTSNWVRISGSILADSAYNYVMLGNFYDDANTDTTKLVCGVCINQYSYYLIDDICVSIDSSLCNGGIDLLSCNVSVNEDELNNQVKIFPIPSKGIVNISSNVLIKSYIIYSSLGQLVINNSPNIKNFQINLTNQPKGIYYLNIKTTKSNIIKKIFIH